MAVPFGCGYQEIARFIESAIARGSPHKSDVSSLSSRSPNKFVATGHV
jgi:hypothetical protein